MSKENPDLITFDCYGTLIDWEGGIVAAFQSEAARDRIELERDKIIEAYMALEPQVESDSYLPYSQVLATTATKVADRLGWRISLEEAGFLPSSLPGWQPFADTNCALERLSTRFQLGILSNTDDDLLQATRKHFTVPFDLIVTAEQVRSYKPGHAHFLEARRRAGDKRWLHAAQSYFHDVVPASQLHIPVAWVNRKGERASEGGPQPTHEVKSLTELADLLGV
ncbi:MAG TPA: HAD family hydrolase [Blastocatellia bacterium]|jgi:2-haloacid dehalogenase/putative hydrolase of the HAD superfamily